MFPETEVNRRWVPAHCEYSVMGAQKTVQFCSKKETQRLRTYSAFKANLDMVETSGKPVRGLKTIRNRENLLNTTRAGLPKHRRISCELQPVSILWSRRNLLGNPRFQTAGRLTAFLIFGHQTAKLKLKTRLVDRPSENEDCQEGFCETKGSKRAVTHTRFFGVLAALLSSYSANFPCSGSSSTLVLVCHSSRPCQDLP